MCNPRQHGWLIDKYLRKFLQVLMYTVLYRWKPHVENKLQTYYFQKINILMFYITKKQNAKSELALPLLKSCCVPWLRVFLDLCEESVQCIVPVKPEP